MRNAIATTNRNNKLTSTQLYVNAFTAIVGLYTKDNRLNKL